MQFAIVHTFEGITLPDYERLYFDESFNTALFCELGLKRDVVKKEQRDRTLEEVVNVGPDRPAPGPIARLFGADRLDYTEHTEYLIGGYRGTWKSTPARMSERVRSEGTMALSRTDEGVKRVIEGKINVQVFGLGRVIERYIVSSLEESYTKAAEFTQRWIDTSRRAASELSSRSQSTVTW